MKTKQYHFMIQSWTKCSWHQSWVFNL